MMLTDEDIKEMVADYANSGDPYHVDPILAELAEVKEQLAKETAGHDAALLQVRKMLKDCHEHIQDNVRSVKSLARERRRNKWLKEMYCLTNDIDEEKLTDDFIDNAIESE